MALKQDRRNANQALYQIGRVFHDDIPLEDVLSVIVRFGFELEDSDVMLLGEHGFTSLPLEHNGTDAERFLVLDWYGHDTPPKAWWNHKTLKTELRTHRWEINCYIS